MSKVTVNLRLQSIDDFFRTPDLDPFSEWYEAYSDKPAIEYVMDCVSDDPRTEHVDVVVGLPREAVDGDSERRLYEAIDRYCNARLIANRRESVRNNSRGWLMMAFSIVVVAFFVWTAQRFSESSHTALSIAAEGLSIAAWVLLWHPLQELVFDRWDHRLDRRALLTLRDRSLLRIEAIPPEAAPTT